MSPRAQLVTVIQSDMDVGPFSVIQPNPVVNGPNPTQPTKEDRSHNHHTQWSIKTRPQIFVKY